jgi:hypothetical protein
MAYKSSKSMIGKMSHSKSTPDVTHKDLIVIVTNKVIKG